MAIWGQSAREIYAAGRAAEGAIGSSILLYDGETWREMYIAVSPILSALWGDG